MEQGMTIEWSYSSNASCCVLSEKSSVTGDNVVLTRTEGDEDIKCPSVATLVEHKPSSGHSPVRHISSSSQSADGSRVISAPPSNPRTSFFANLGRTIEEESNSRMLKQSGNDVTDNNDDVRLAKNSDRRSRSPSPPKLSPETTRQQQRVSVTPPPSSAYHHLPVATATDYHTMLLGEQQYQQALMAHQHPANSSPYAALLWQYYSASSHQQQGAKLQPSPPPAQLQQRGQDSLFSMAPSSDVTHASSASDLQRSPYYGVRFSPYNISSRH